MEFLSGRDLALADQALDLVEKRLVSGNQGLGLRLKPVRLESFVHNRACRQVGLTFLILWAQLSPERLGDKVLNLLAVTFDLGDDPAGEVTLHFSEGAAIRLSVECIEAQMKDLGPVWEAVATPGHPDGA